MDTAISNSNRPTSPHRRSIINIRHPRSSRRPHRRLQDLTTPFLLCVCQLWSPSYGAVNQLPPVRLLLLLCHLQVFMHPRTERCSKDLLRLRKWLNHHQRPTRTSSRHTTQNRNTFPSLCRLTVHGRVPMAMCLPNRRKPGEPRGNGVACSITPTLKGQCRMALGLRPPRQRTEAIHHTRRRLSPTRMPMISEN